MNMNTTPKHMKVEGRAGWAVLITDETGVIHIESGNSSFSEHGFSVDDITLEATHVAIERGKITGLMTDPSRKKFSFAGSIRQLLNSLSKTSDLSSVRNLKFL
jgi:hypothetical protein